MGNFFENREKINALLEAYYQTREGRRLKYGCYACAAGMMIMLGVILYFMDELSLRALLWLRGFCGVLACIFIILTMVMVYRAHKNYWDKRNKGED
ncbi:MAG: hypothetical protein K2M67_01530 [Muribaculaceae bacterium]|nr:hypothetical protein [Muribaculaceae bacterium]